MFGGIKKDLRGTSTLIKVKVPEFAQRIEVPERATSRQE